jgi:hypothetical protein
MGVVAAAFCRAPSAGATCGLVLITSYYVVQWLI